MSATPFLLPGVATYVKDIRAPIWDVKFYPYLTGKDDWTIFAAVGHWDVFCCRLNEDTEEAIEVLAHFSRDKTQQDLKHTVNSCTWCYLESSNPLLAITGENGQIEIIDPLTGERHFLLGGHGLGVVNDLATHPKYPWIMASCSIDQSIRIWDLRRANKPRLSPTIIICGQNHAHKEGIISISWHQTGRYIVSGGFDQKVCVWTIPDLRPGTAFWEDLEKPKRSSDEVHVIYYPHFITSAIHSEYVDAVAFYGDLIISKACREDKVVLWSITGFNSRHKPPTSSQAPKTLHHLETRNGFLRKPKTKMEDDVFEGEVEGVPPFIRLVEFANDKSESFYMRFGLLQPSELFPELHTVLSVGDNVSKVKHWDLDRFISKDEDDEEPTARPPPPKPRPVTKGIAQVINRSSPVSRSPSVTTKTDGRETSTAATSISEHEQVDGIKLDWVQGMAPLKYHGQNDCFKHIEWLTIRGVAWSSCGRWCVAAGETSSSTGPQGAMVILDRRKGRMSSNHIA